MSERTRGPRIVSVVTRTVVWGGGPVSVRVSGGVRRGNSGTLRTWCPGSREVKSLLFCLRFLLSLNGSRGILSGRRRRIDLRGRVDGSGTGSRGDDWSQGRRPESYTQVRGSVRVGTTLFCPIRVLRVYSPRTDGVGVLRDGVSDPTPVRFRGGGVPLGVLQGDVSCERRR